MSSDVSNVFYCIKDFKALVPGLYSNNYRNSVSQKAIILHLIYNLIISALTARAVDRVASRAEAFLAGQMPCHALPWRRHSIYFNDYATEYKPN